MALRIAVGYHFFKEGTNKLKYGFNAYGFLAGAKGPLAPAFKGMIDDNSGMKKLCILKSQKDGKTTFTVDTESTIKEWEEFTAAATDYYGLGSIPLQEELAQKRAVIAAEIEAARDQKDSNVNTAELGGKRDELEAEIGQIRLQPQRLEEIRKIHIEILKDWVKENRVDLIAHFSTEDRLQGFASDGKDADEVSLEVDSLRGQVDTIRSDRNKKLRGWSNEVTAMWDSLETKVDTLVVPLQRRSEPLKLNRPFDPKLGSLKTINMVIPWFDTIVGVCMILGLFTRFASLSAGLFLLSVCLTQPFWIPGTNPTYLYWIEMTACFVIFGTLAGRMGGLDYIIHGLFVGDKTTHPVEN